MKSTYTDMGNRSIVTVRSGQTANPFSLEIVTKFFFTLVTLKYKKTGLVVIGVARCKSYYITCNKRLIKIEEIILSVFFSPLYFFFLTLGHYVLFGKALNPKLLEEES